MENSSYCQSLPINESWNSDEMTNPMTRQNNDLTQNNFAACLSFKTPQLHTSEDSFLSTMMSNLNVKKESSLVNLVGYVTHVFQPPPTAVIQQSPGSDPVQPGTVIWLRKYGGNINDIDGYRAIGEVSEIFVHNNELIYHILLYNSVDMCLRIDSQVFSIQGNH